MYGLNKLVWVMANPLFLGLTFLFAGLLLKTIGLCNARSEARSRKVFKIAWSLVFLAFIWFWLWGTKAWTRVVGYRLERDYLVDAAGEMRMRPAFDYPNADAIVVLGGGCGARTSFYNGVMLNAAADRAYFGAQLWKEEKAPLVIPSGWGATDADRRFMIDLGVSADSIVADDEARNTEENAKFVREILRERLSHIERVEHVDEVKPKILLVTSAWHMKRGLLMFAKYATEVECIPAACDFESVPQQPLCVADFLPNVGAFECNCRYFHEWLGILGYSCFRK